MPTLYSADVCPFAQRPRALCTLLDIPFERRVVDLEQRDADFLAISPTGRVPLWVDGDLKLYESQVICEYLADRAEWSAAWHADPGTRARQRLAMKQWDGEVNRWFYRSLGGQEPTPEERAQLAAELREIDATIQTAASEEPDLLSLHVAPFWARMQWLAEATFLPALVAEHEHLANFANRAVELDCVRTTLPDRATTVERYLQRFAG